MSISFACGQCDKSFTVDDRFAGKQGRCKQCGTVMPIPGASGRGGPVAVSSATRSEVDREVSPSRRAPAVASTSPRDDVYGFEDEPLPPRQGGVPGSDGLGTLPTASRPKKKKAFGFFAGSKKKKTLHEGGPTAGMAIGRVVVGIVAGIGGLLASSLGLPGVRQMLVPGWTTRGQIESFVQNHLRYTSALAGVIRGVTDVPSARSSSGRANAAVRKLIENLLANKDRKGNQKEIEAIREKYRKRTQDAVFDFTSEMLRLASIPGALDALAIEGSLKELADIEASIPGAGGGAPDFSPLQIRPPAMPPRFNPPMPGVPNSGQVPGFNPGGPAPPPPMGPRPPFGGRRPGFGPVGPPG